MKAWWRAACFADRAHALVAAFVVVPWFVWATVTWRTGRLGYGAGAAMGYMLLYLWSAVRVERRRRALLRQCTFPRPRDGVGGRVRRL